MTRLLLLSLVLTLSLSAQAQRQIREPEGESESPKKERTSPSAKEQQQQQDQAADKKYLDLQMYYLDGEYEKCYKKSLNVTEDEETGKDAAPYLFVSMSLYEMMFLDQYKKDYPDALKESLKFAAKYRKKDEKNSAKQGLNYLEFWEENKTFFNKLRKTAKDSAQGQLDNNKVAKAEQLYKAILAFDPSDFSAYYMLGTLRLEANDTANARKNMEAFDAEIKKVETLSEEPADKIALLKYAHFEYARFLVLANRTDAAKLVIEHLKGYIGKDEDIDAFVAKEKL